MFKQTCTVVGNKKIAPGHWVLKLRSVAIAKAAKPGQFVQILCANDSFDPLLPRPFSFLDSNGSDFSILFHVVGKGTELLSKVEKGDSLRVLGPLGNGFTLRLQTADCRLQTVMMVGGGVGIPPLYHLAKEFLRNKMIKSNTVEVLLGARHKSLLLCEKEFEKLGVKLSVATDDGSKGHQGFVTEILTRRLQSAVSGLQSRIYTCGPTPMLKAVSALSVKYGVPCEVSVEVPMACGFGACLGCAIKVKTVDSRQKTVDAGQPRSTVYCLPSTDYRFAIACTEGPVFQASEIVWD